MAEYKVLVLNENKVTPLEEDCTVGDPVCFYEKVNADIFIATENVASETARETVTLEYFAPHEPPFEATHILVRATTFVFEGLDADSSNVASAVSAAVSVNGRGTDISKTVMAHRGTDGDTDTAASAIISAPINSNDPKKITIEWDRSALDGSVAYLNVYFSGYEKTCYPDLE